MKYNKFLFSLVDSPVISELKALPLMEFLVEDLKAYDIHKTFLNRVSKKIAPTYYDVIKNPMDLTKVSKNIFFYNIDTFFADIELIWSNCEFFNKDVPFYTDLAQKMRKKTASLRTYYFGGIEYESLKKVCYVDRTVIKSDVWVDVRKFVIMHVCRLLKDCGIERVPKKALDVLCDVFIFKYCKLLREMGVKNPGDVLPACVNE